MVVAKQSKLIKKRSDNIFSCMKENMPLKLYLYSFKYYVYLKNKYDVYRNILCKLLCEVIMLTRNFGSESLLLLGWKIVSFSFINLLSLFALVEILCSRNMPQLVNTLVKRKE